MRSTQLALAVVALVVWSSTGLGEQATVPFRAGDTVTGRLTRCGEYHVLETQLLRGEVLRMRIVPDVITANVVHARVFGPDGFQITQQTRLRQDGGQLVLGPFRTRDTGLHRIQLTTYAAHGVRYHASSRVRRQRKRVIRLRGARDAATVRGTAGATLTMKARGANPGLAVTTPGGQRHVWESDSSQLQALLGDGLSLAEAGLYRFERLDRKSRLRLVLKTPQARAAQTVEFPALPAKPPTTGAWYWSGRWVAVHPSTSVETDTPRLPMPPDVAPPPPVNLETTAAPQRVAALTDTLTWTGPLSGAGLPLSGIPSLQELTERGVVTPTNSGTDYVFDRTVDGIGTVHVRARFSIDGQDAIAPLAWGGRMSLTWTTSNDAGTLTGKWTLTNDADHGVRVLTGGETWIDVGYRQVTSAANSFTLGGTGGWPQGELRWGEVDPRSGTRFQRVETHSGDGVVDVRLQHGETVGTPVRVELR